ncbi:TonB family protein [Sphingomonas sp. CJ20]
MYADTRYAAPKSRTVSLGAAFAINGAIIAGLVFSAPYVVKEKGHTPITIYDPFDPPVPPPVEQPKPQPEAKVERTTTVPKPTVPDPLIKTAQDPIIAGTTEVPPSLPPAGGSFETGPLTEPTTVKALPPLIAPSQDPRYLKDFQPAYPAAELRAQRDGQVSIRVLIGIDGRVKEVQQLRATSDAFFEATRRQALSKWRFKPATRGGIPEESWRVMTVRFELANQ